MKLYHGSYDFRPLAGIMVLIDFAEKMECVGLITFPSPCGDYGSYRLPLASLKTLPRTDFRPLAGIMVLIDQI